MEQRVLVEDVGVTSAQIPCARAGKLLSFPPDFQSKPKFDKRKTNVTDLTRDVRKGGGARGLAPIAA